MNLGNGLGVASLVFIAIYVSGSYLPPGVVIANLRGLSLILILPLSLAAGWKGSRLWWIVSAGMIAMAIMYVVALSEHR